MVVASLLGLQSPIVELVLAGIVVFLLSALYLGLRFEGVGSVAESEPDTGDEPASNEGESRQPQPGRN
ncbi:hypothetical protein [Halorientalis pallida]|uniref:Uncharacterized protein n=1 Tax=Halorientalis pallida TaxID=2479928 RepID=A0A498KZ22_9EURY|nr:hypothetical protein [Halorientalis pallida]RXK51278.1 hypothetical protein EAF64_01155 [Halorientalis pallida]